MSDDKPLFEKRREHMELEQLIDKRKIHFFEEKAVWHVACEVKLWGKNPRRVTVRPNEVTCTRCLFKMKGRK